MVKPVGSGLPLDAISRVLGEAHDYRTLIGLRVLAEVVTNAFEQGEISPIEGVLTHIDQYMGALERHEITIDEINAIVAHNNVKGAVLVPIEYLEVIVSGWRQYFERDGEITLGEALKLEGGGQGKRKRLATLKNILRDVSICDRVEFALIDAEKSGRPISRETAFDMVAEMMTANGEPISAATVKRVYARRGARLRTILMSHLFERTTS